MITKEFILYENVWVKIVAQYSVFFKKFSSGINIKLKRPKLAHAHWPTVKRIILILN